LLQVFAALKEKSHETAYNQITRLVSIEKNDVFLSSLKNSELNNIYLEKAQNQLDKLQFKEAQKTISEAMLTYGRNRTFLAAQKDIETMGKIYELSQKMNKVSTGAEMEKNTTEMISLLEQLPSGKQYIPAFKNRLETAHKMQTVENERALFSMYSEIAYQRQLGNEAIANLIAAELYACDPSKETLKNAIGLQNDAGPKKE